jgi:hypothetical protein
MNWKFSQLSGKLWDSFNGYLGKGYAGHGDGKNNPDMENVEGVGPLPHGAWKPVEFFEDHPRVGKNAVRLEPADDDTLQRVINYGRDPKSFFMHGDSVEHPGEASDGCIIQAPDIRLKFWQEKPLIDVIQTSA